MNELSKMVAEALDLQQIPNLADWFAIAGISILAFIVIRNIFADDGEVEKVIKLKGPKVEEPAEPVVEEPVVEEPVVEVPAEEAKVAEPAPVKVAWHQRLVKGLEQTRKDVWGKVGNILKSSNLTEEQFEEIEEILYGSDLSPIMVEELLEELKKKSKSEGESSQDFLEIIKEFLKSKMVDAQSKVNKELYHFESHEKTHGPKVIMIVGVNGAGKTTTIGKLATKLKAQGAKVVVGACDTFRAAAVEQLEVWCRRADVQIVKAAEGADPTGVAYDAVKVAKEIEADYCIIDTAGRLHTKSNLMDELTKTKKVMSKIIPEAPHESLLVVDAITGQNALRQAEEFNKALDLSGLIFTKCDGSSKAGSAVGIVKELNVPIVYIGVGESVDDLNIFDLDEYLNALLGIE